VQYEENSQTTTVEGIAAESVQNPIPQTEETEKVQNPIIQKKKPEGVQIQVMQTKEKKSTQNPITPIIIIRSAIGWTPSKPNESVQVPIAQSGMSENYDESAEKTRAAQARLIEIFEQKRDERLRVKEGKHGDLRLDSKGDIVDMTSSRSQSAQTGSPVFSDRSSSNSSEDQSNTRPIEQDGGCQRDHRGRNRKIPEEEVYRSPRSGHYTDAEYDNQALEAWRNQCRKSHDYMPDRDYPMEVHGKHLRILQAAIRDFKVKKKSQRLEGKALLEFAHARYSHLQQKYGIPQRIRTGKELMDYSKKDPSVLRQYISMLTA
jgi:hypothetical protein